MVENKEVVQAERKAWVQPELKRIEAGSAEGRPDGLRNDGGMIGSQRS